MAASVEGTVQHITGQLGLQSIFLGKLLERVCRYMFTMSVCKYIEKDPAPNL